MAKVVNYTPAQTEELVKTYSSAEDQAERTEIVLFFANKFNKHVRSVIAKLSREDVYVKPERKTKVGGEVVKKEELATRIAIRVGVAPENFDSLAKANKAVLLRLLTHIGNLENNVLALEKVIAGEPELEENAE